MTFTTISIEDLFGLQDSDVEQGKESGDDDAPIKKKKKQAKKSQESKSEEDEEYEANTQSLVL